MARYLLGLSRYLHLNPVRGAVLGAGTPAQRRNRLRAYPWSSYRGYAGLAKAFAFIEEDLVLGELQAARAKERQRYRRFVEEALVREIESPFEAVQWQAVLGGESFVRRMQDRIKEMTPHGREVTAVRRAVKRSLLLEVIRRVARSFAVAESTLVGPWGVWAGSAQCGDGAGVGEMRD